MKEVLSNSVAYTPAEDTLAGDMYPAPHGVHWAFPTPTDADPPVHCIQNVEELDGADVPEGQLVHSDDASNAEYFPGLHDVHSPTPMAGLEYQPFWQGRHPVLFSFENVPGGQK